MSKNLKHYGSVNALKQVQSQIEQLIEGLEDDLFQNPVAVVEETVKDCAIDMGTIIAVVKNEVSADTSD